jgi:hypothetical protein
MPQGAAPELSGMPTTKPRLSINLSAGEYAELSALAERNNLSMAWLGHKALLDFLAQARSESLQLPLALSRRDIATRAEKADSSLT